MKEQKNDGKALERAVHLIQETLLKNDPTLKGGNFTIELNKHITVDGTRHEIDVYVTAHPGTKYESIVLFECKDLSKSVSKNDVIILKEKVDLLGATRGILVARELSRDAEALLARYKRIQFRRCTDDINGLLTIDVVHTVHDSLGITVRVTPRDALQSFPANIADQPVRWGNNVSTLTIIGHRRVHAISNMDKVDYRRLYDVESVHWRPLRECLDFNPGEFSVAGIDVAILEVYVTFFVHVIRHSPRYRCSIDGDGQVLSFELVDQDFPTGKLDLTVVITECQNRSNL